MAYLSDVGSGFAETRVEGLPEGGPSLDHAMWFHERIRLDDWVFLDMWPLKAGGSRGLYAGAIHDANETLGCMLAQEVLLRDRHTQKDLTADHLRPGPSGPASS